MENEIIRASEFGLQDKQAKNVDEAFADKVSERKAISKVYSQLITKEINEETAKEARDLRLKAVKIKTGIATIHKSQKEFALSFGKYCDAWKRKETEPIQQMIDGALEIEKFEERKEKERIEALHDLRSSKIYGYMDDIIGRNFGAMQEDEFEALFILKRTQHEELESAKEKAEQERIEKEKAEAIERKRISEENERLKKESQEKELALKVERESRAKEDAIRIAAEKEAQEKRDAEKRKEREDFEAKLKAEQEESEKIAEELRKKEESERLAKEAIEREKQAELNKGDAEKVKDLINDLEAIKNKYEFKSTKNKKTYSQVCELLDKVVDHINK